MPTSKEPHNEKQGCERSHPCFFVRGGMGQQRGLKILRLALGLTQEEMRWSWLRICLAPPSASRLAGGRRLPPPPTGEARAWVRINETGRMCLGAGGSLISHGACVRRAMTASPAGGSTGRAADSRPYGKRRRVPRRGDPCGRPRFCVGARRGGIRGCLPTAGAEAGCGFARAWCVRRGCCAGPSRTPAPTEGRSDARGSYRARDGAGRSFDSPLDSLRRKCGGAGCGFAWPPFRQPPRRRSAAATSPTGEARAWVRIYDLSFFSIHSSWNNELPSERSEGSSLC